MAPQESPETVVVLNPESGGEDHSETVRSWADSLGYAVEETAEAGDAVALARDAAESGAATVVAAGGDGTVNEVVRGIDEAGALDRTALGVVPTGTGNNFAGNLGIAGIDDAFDVVSTGERRRIDLGTADGRPFVNSCVGGLTADSSSETSSEMKRRLGVVAYVVTTLRSAAEFDPLWLTVTAEGADDEPSWSGDALAVLVGNARRFTPAGSTQGNVEDGRLDVLIVEDVSAVDLMSDAVAEQLLGREAAHVSRLRVPALTVEVHDPGTARFSLDGEIIRRRRLSVSVRSRALEVAVGDGYDPDPEVT